MSVVSEPPRPLREWGFCHVRDRPQMGKVRTSSGGASVPPSRKVTSMSRKVRIAALAATLVALVGATGLSSANARADTSWGAPVISLLG